MSDSLEVQLGSLRLRNPLLAASGTFGSGVEARDFADLSRFGGIVTKTVTTGRRRGNPPPRIHETSSGLLNSIGLMNPGMDRFVADVLPLFEELPCTRIVNVAGVDADDFAALCGQLDGFATVEAIELNVSCPNVSGGLDYGTDPAAMEAVVRACRQKTDKPLIVKLTPNVTDVTVLARAAEAGGADILSMVNTYLGMAIDWRARVPELGSPTGMGGLSGPAIKPLALAVVNRVKAVTELPIIGIGGIDSAEDVMEFLVAGATAVQVGTSNFADPDRIGTIARELEELVANEDLGSLSGWIGTLSPRMHH